MATVTQLIADSREREKAIVDGVDGVQFLSYLNADDPAHPYSYDLLLECDAGAALRWERKATLDLIQSFAKGKLDRQLRAVHALVIEWDERDITMHAARTRNPTRFLQLARNTRKHIARLTMEWGLPVVWTQSAAETIEFLRYLGDKLTEDPAAVDGHRGMDDEKYGGVDVET